LDLDRHGTSHPTAGWPAMYVSVVVFRAFLDRLGHCMRQSIGVGTKPAAWCPPPWPHRSVLLRPLYLELPSTRWRMRPRVHTDNGPFYVCHAEGRIGLHPRQSTGYISNLRALSAGCSRLAHRIVVADPPSRVGTASLTLGSTSRKESGGVPITFFRPGMPTGTRQLVERDSGVQHPVFCSSE